MRHIKTLQVAMLCLTGLTMSFHGITVNMKESPMTVSIPVIEEPKKEPLAKMEPEAKKTKKKW